MTTPEAGGTSSSPWYTPPAADAQAPLPQAWPAVPEQVPAADLPVPAPVHGYGPPPQQAWQQGWQQGGQQGPVGGPVWAPPRQRLASPGARLGALLLDLVLVVVTLGIGWFIWSLVVWGQGTTPAKGLLRQRVVVAGSGATASWGRMALRQAVVGGAASWLLGTVSFGLWFVADALTVFSDRHRRLTDRIVGTLVVQD